jgi:hypothetical protein
MSSAATARRVIGMTLIHPATVDVGDGVDQLAIANAWWRQHVGTCQMSISQRTTLVRRSWILGMAIKTATLARLGGRLPARSLKAIIDPKSRAPPQPPPGPGQSVRQFAA